jgi:hypothetical protein
VYGGVVDIQNDSALTISKFSQVPGNQQSPTTTIGPNVTCTTATVYGGNATLEGATTSLTVSSNAIVTVAGAGTVDTVYVQQQGNVKWKSSGDVGTEVNTYSGGTFDLSEDGEAVTIPLVTMYSGSAWKDPIGRATYTSGIVVEGCKMSDVQIDVGFSRTLGVS